jgi:hypothetical protein
MLGNAVSGSGRTRFGSRHCSVKIRTSPCIRNVILVSVPTLLAPYGYTHSIGR